MEEIKKIEVQGQQYGVADLLLRSVMGGNAQVIEWSHTHNMNDYKDAGTYRIKGERTGSPMDDNLPIMNSGSGNSIDGVLMVMDSTLSDENTDDNFNVCITQFLMLSNRVGGQEGDMYMRSAYGNTKDNLTWKAWEKYQTNMEVGCVSDAYLLNPINPTQVLQSGVGMKCFLDNGIYSGVYVGPKTMIGTTKDVNIMNIKDLTAIETFVMIVINNYVAYGAIKHVTQIKFGVTNGGVFSMEKRVANSFNVNGIGNTYGDFSQWVPIGGGNGEWDNYTYKIAHPESDSRSITIGASTTIGDATIIAKNVQIGQNTNIGINTRICGNIEIGTGSGGYHLQELMGTSFVEGKSVKLPYGLNAQNVTWNHESNANTFTTQGYYLITGERTGENDNLPLSDKTLGSGHTLRMVLTVLDSSLPNVGNDSKDCCITQILQCSNRTGGDGNVYVRTASGVDKDNLIWEPWGKLQTNVEVGQVYNLEQFIDNGMYSGVLLDNMGNHKTFVMVVINNYAVAGLVGKTRSITQFIYSLDVEGNMELKYRVGVGDDSIAWGAGIIIGNDESGRWLNNDDFIIEHPNNNAGSITIGSNVQIKACVRITENVNMGWKNRGLTIGTSNTLPSNSEIIMGTNVRIGSDVHIASNIKLLMDSGGEQIDIKHGDFTILSIGTNNHIVNTHAVISEKVHITKGVCIGTGFDGDTSAVALKVQVNEAGDKVIFSYNGKTAELQLT